MQHILSADVLIEYLFDKFLAGLGLIKANDSQGTPVKLLLEVEINTINKDFLSVVHFSLRL